MVSQVSEDGEIGVDGVIDDILRHMEKVKLFVISSGPGGKNRQVRLVSMGELFIIKCEPDVPEVAKNRRGGNKRREGPGKRAGTPAGGGGEEE